MLRVLTIVGILAFVSGCQTGSTDTSGALSSAVGTSDVETTDAGTGEAQALDADGNPIVADDAEISEAQNLDADGNPIVAEADAEETNAAASDPSADTSAVSEAQPSSDPTVAAVQAMASIRNKDGEAAAVVAVFNCYKKARERSASLERARICAAQDFVVSREVISSRPTTATGTNDRALFVSKRHAERIGALMKLKGMNQSQFNTFGAYLHAVAEPEYQKARTS